MVVQIIEGKNRERHKDLFATMFRAQYEAFIVERAWSLPTRHGLEIDQYDNDRAVYILDFDDAGHLQGSVRLTPTVTDSLTADYYPHLCETETKLRDTLVYEGTRYIASPREKTAQTNRVVKARVLGAMTEWGFSVGVQHIQAVIDTALFKSFMATNSKTFALGPASPYGGGKGVPGGGHVSCGPNPRHRARDQRSSGLWRAQRVAGPRTLRLSPGIRRAQERCLRASHR